MLFCLQLHGFARKVCLPNLRRKIAKSSLIKSLTNVRLRVSNRDSEIQLFCFPTRAMFQLDRLVKLHAFDDYYARVHRDNYGIAILERVSIPFYIENNENSVVTIHEERVITIDCYLINIRSYETYKNIRNSDHFAELLYSEFNDLNLSEIFLNGYFIKINSDKIII